MKKQYAGAYNQAFSCCSLTTRVKHVAQNERSNLVINPIAAAKYRMSHIDDRNPLYRISTSIWDTRDVDNGKTCVFYWFKFPGAIFSWCFLCTYYALALVIGPFFGCFPAFIPTKDPDLVDYKYYHTTRLACFYPYKRLPWNGKHMAVAPWEIIGVLVVIGLVLSLLYSLIFVYPLVGMLMGGLVLACFVLCGILFVLSKNWTNPAISVPRRNLVYAWNKACPPLVVEHKRKEKMTRSK